MLIPQSCYQRWREIGAPHARALAIATGSRVPMPRVAAAAVVEQTSSAESLDLEPPKETAQEGDSLCQGPKGQKLVKLKRGRLYRMRKRVIQQAVKQTSSIRRQNLMEDLEHGVGMGSNSTAASSSAVEDAKPKAKAKANAKAVAASGEQKEEENSDNKKGPAQEQHQSMRARSRRKMFELCWPTAISRPHRFDTSESFWSSTWA